MTEDDKTMKHPALNATIAMGMICGLAMGESAGTDPATPKELVTEPSSTTFPLGAVPDLPKLREYLTDLCDEVPFGLEPTSLDKFIRGSVSSASDRKLLTDEAAKQIEKLNTRFRQMLRKEAGITIKSFVADINARAPKTATVSALASHPKGGFLPFSWKVVGLEGAPPITSSTTRPARMTETLNLNIPSKGATLKIPLKWEGTVSLDAEWKMQCSDHVSGVINTSRTEVRAERWCRPKLSVSVRCEWPLAGVKSGKGFEEQSKELGANIQAGRYVVPLKAGKKLALEDTPSEERK